MTGTAGRHAFHDRPSAGRQLAAKLAHHRGPHTVVLGLPRGGVPVAAAIAAALAAQLDVAVVRKVGHPVQPELAVGAVAEDGVVVLNEDLLDSRLDPGKIDDLVANKSAEVQQWVSRFRGGRGPPDLRDRVAIVVDDGIATGATAKAALKWVRSRSPRRLVLAVPVLPAATIVEFRALVDELVFVMAPDRLQAVGLWYDDFTPASDDDVDSLLGSARARIAVDQVP